MRNLILIVSGLALSIGLLIFIGMKMGGSDPHSESGHEVHAEKEDSAGSSAEDDLLAEMEGIEAGAQDAVDSEISQIATKDTSGHCVSVEVLGRGPGHQYVTRREWSRIIDLYHQAKRNLLHWLDERQSRIPAKTAAMMRSRVKSLLIERPPTQSEPDLSWRGIGVLSENKSGNDVIRLGGGFVDLVRSDAMRAKFELTRLVAQVWSPCDLKLLSGGHPWGSLLGCVNVDAKQVCRDGSLGEEAWAVSSLLAYEIAHPGCELVALDSEKTKTCIAQVMGSRDTAGEKVTK